MVNALKTCLIWRVLAAIGSFIGRTFRSSRLLQGLMRWWNSSGTCGFLTRTLGRDAVWCDQSGISRLALRCNRRLADIHRPFDWFHSSLVGHAYSAVFRWGRGSALLGWVFGRGFTGIVLLALALYCGVDYVLRDVLAISALASIWDEGLLAVSLLWILRLRMDRKSPMESRLTPLDLPILAFMVLGFWLMNTIFDYYFISVAGYRATVQYMLWFFVVTRLLRDDRDLMVLYYGMVALATIIAVHGVYQYIAAVPIPSHWTDQAEQSVRTRVFSIFGSPNIMADYMVMFAPMAAGLAYYLKKPWQKVLAWICTFLMCFGCLFTMSRAGWMAMAVAVVIFCLIVDKRLFGLLVAAAAGACFLPFVASRIGYLFTEQFAESTVRGGRSGRWHYGLLYLQESGHPWLGLGLGMFGGAIAVQNKIIDQWDYFYMDNYYLKIMAEMGYLGFAAFIILLVFLVVIACRGIFRSKVISKPEGGESMKPLAAGMFAGICGVLMHCYFENIFEEPYMMAYFWIMAAMIVYIGFIRPKAESTF